MYAENNPIKNIDSSGLKSTLHGAKCTSPGAVTSRSVKKFLGVSFAGFKAKYQWCYQQYMCCKILLWSGYRWKAVGKPYNCGSVHEDWLWSYYRK
jgi:hypothetical protein